MTDEDDRPRIGSTPPEDAGMVMIVVGPPPQHLDLSRSPDPNDPRVAALLRSAARMIARDPGRFPLRGPYSVGLILRSATEFDEPEEEGTDAWVIVDVERVLIRAGVLPGGPEVDGDRFEIDPALSDGYSIEIEVHRHEAGQFWCEEVVPRLAEWLRQILPSGVEILHDGFGESRFMTFNQVVRWTCPTTCQR